MNRTIELASHVLEKVGNRAEAEIVVTGGESALTRFANSFIHQNVAEEGYDVSLRVAVDGDFVDAFCIPPSRPEERRFLTARALTSLGERCIVFRKTPQGTKGAP